MTSWGDGGKRGGVLPFPLPNKVKFNKVTLLFPCSSVKEKTYELATHSVKVKRSGMLSDVSALWDMGDSEALAGCALLESNRCKIQRLPSINTFNKVRLA